MYDYVFLTHLPSFYKVNLYNELSKSKKIFVIFSGKASQIRSGDFTADHYKFDYIFLKEGAFEQTNSVKELLKLLLVLTKLNYRRLVVGGWERLEFWLGILVAGKEKSALTLESSIMESSISGFRGILKKLFISRVNLVFTSGTQQRALLSQLAFKGKVVITHGVGLIQKPKCAVISKKYEKKFVYLGRLSEEKNLAFLIQVFGKMPEFSLEIVGNGPLFDSLKENQPANVAIIPHVAQTEIHTVFERNDFLVLPSIREPWGLVVDESMYYGRPVVISTACGAVDLVKSDTGYVFKSGDAEELTRILNSISHEQFEHFMKIQLREKIVAKDLEQVQVYLDQGNSP